MRSRKDSIAARSVSAISRALSATAACIVRCLRGLAISASASTPLSARATLSANGTFTREHTMPVAASDPVPAASARKSRPAPLWRRIAALVYDVFPLAGLWMITGFACLFAFGRHYDPAHPAWATRLGLQLALLAVTVAYFVISWTRIGQTIDR